MNALRLLLLVLAALLVQAGGATQTPPPRAPSQAPAGPPGCDLGQAHGIVHDGEGMPWAIGRDYKASFAGGGIEFTPALGPRAAHNRPLRFDLMTIARGAEQLHVATANVAPRVDGDRLTLTRGVMTERYDCRPEGVEQSFVLPQRPGGHGDLIVRGAITTQLQADPRSDGTWFFHDRDVGGVSIGTVTGIDARGQRCAGTVQFADGVLELRLPDEFVERAEYPLVLDPLLATGFLAGSSVLDDDFVDAAFEETLDVWLVVWRRSFSAVDQDIQAQRVTSSGALFGSVVALSLTGTAETRPTVAAVNSRSRFVVVWQASPNGYGPWRIEATTVSTATSTAVVVVSPAGQNASSPTLCGDRGLTGTKALVAWRHGGGVDRRALDVSTTGSLTLGSVHTTGIVGFAFADWPRLPKSRTPGAATMMLFGTQLFVTTLFVEPVDYDGQSLQSPWQLPLGGAGALAVGADGMLDIDGDGADFLVACVSSATGNGTTAAFSWNGTALAAGPLATFATPTPSRCRVAWLGERFLIAWEVATPSPFDSEVRLLTVKPDCTACSVEVAVPVVARPNQRVPAIGACFHGGGDDRALVAWSEANITLPFTSSVVVQWFEAMTGSAPLLLSGSCPGGGTATAEGPFALGSEQFALLLTGGDPTAPLALLGLGAGGQPPIVCGCSFVASLATHVVPALNGGARFPFPLPCDPLLLGFQLEAQWLLIGVANGPCPLVPWLTGSERLLLTLSL